MAASNETTNDHTEDRALNTLIVGTGIGGLAAAVGLRQQGHHVKVGHGLERTKRRIEQ
jgi:2-polyprenyl-6-methoxyphenol hydroxylase-like FAD-dependent oxidoreductase